MFYGKNMAVAFHNIVTMDWEYFFNIANLPFKDIIIMIITISYDSNHKSLDVKESLFLDS